MMATRKYTPNLKNSVMNNIFITSILLILILNGCERSNKVSDLKCKYMGYTTGGDGEPNYMILELDGDSTKFSNSELNIQFANDSSEILFDKQVGICGICFDYYFSGNLDYNKEKKYYEMVVDSYSLKLDSACCDLDEFEKLMKE